MSHQLYRHFDTDGKLLYVGISINAAMSRLATHRTNSEWFDQIAAVSIERFDSKEKALGAERLAIKSERPAFNRNGLEKLFVESAGAVKYRKQQAIWRKRRERLAALLAAGLARKEIAKRLGISRQRLSQIERAAA